MVPEGMNRPRRDGMCLLRDRISNGESRAMPGVPLKRTSPQRPLLDAPPWSDTGSTAEAIVTRSTVSQNSSRGFYFLPAAGGTTLLTIADSTIVDNATAFDGTNSPTVYTLGNNTIERNTIDLNGVTLTSRTAR